MPTPNHTTFEGVSATARWLIVTPSKGEWKVTSARFIAYPLPHSFWDTSPTTDWCRGDLEGLGGKVTRPHEYSSPPPARVLRIAQRNRPRTHLCSSFFFSMKEPLKRTLFGGITQRFSTSGTRTRTSKNLNSQSPLRAEVSGVILRCHCSVFAEKTVISACFVPGSPYGVSKKTLHCRLHRPFQLYSQSLVNRDLQRLAFQFTAFFFSSWRFLLPVHCSRFWQHNADAFLSSAGRYTNTMRQNV